MPSMNYCLIKRRVLVKSIFCTKSYNGYRFGNIETCRKSLFKLRPTATLYSRISSAYNEHNSKTYICTRIQSIMPLCISVSCINLPSSCVNFTPFEEKETKGRIKRGKKRIKRDQRERSNRE